MVFRAVLVGCGRISRWWFTAITQHPLLAGRVEIVGLVDLDRATAEARAAEFGLSHVLIGTDLDAVLAETKPELLFDVVVPEAREAVVAAGLRHGCHILSEKPVAESLAMARQMIEAARKAGRVHAVVQNRRFNPGIRRIRRLLESGVIGELTALQCDFSMGIHFQGFRATMQHVLLLDMAIHPFDAARFIADAQPNAVYCLETNPRGSCHAHGGVVDAIFEFDRGIVFNYRGSYCAEGFDTGWEGRWRVVGTRGTLVWDGAETIMAKIALEGAPADFRELAEVEVPQAEDEQIHGHASVIREFVDAIAANRPPETAIADNIKSLAMVFGAIDSARAGQKIAIAV